MLGLTAHKPKSLKTSVHDSLNNSDNLAADGEFYAWVRLISVKFYPFPIAFSIAVSSFK